MTGLDTLVSALEKRFDFHSARVVANEAATQAGLAERSDWSQEDLALAIAHVTPTGKDLKPVLEQLGLAAPEASA